MSTAEPVSSNKPWHARMLALMEKQSLSVRDVSERSGIDYDSVFKYTKGKVEYPRGTRLKKLADALGTTEKELLFGEQ